MPKSIGELMIWIVVAAACIALMFVAVTQFGITIPMWVVHVFWIVVVAFVVVVAIKFVMKL